MQLCSFKHAGHTGALRQRRSRYQRAPFLPPLEFREELTVTQIARRGYRQGRQLLRQYLQEIGYTGEISELVMDVAMTMCSDV